MFFWLFPGLAGQKLAFKSKHGSWDEIANRSNFFYQKSKSILHPDSAKMIFETKQGKESSKDEKNGFRVQIAQKVAFACEFRRGHLFLHSAIEWLKASALVLQTE